MKKAIPLVAGLFAAALLAVTPLHAQEPLTLEQARSDALAHSRSLRQALLAVDAARLTEKLQSYELLPSLSASVGAGTSYPSARDPLSGSLGLSVSQTLYNRKRSLLAAIDELDTGIAREQARAAYFDVLEEVDAAFYGVLEAQAAVQAAQSDLEAYRTHLRLAQARLEVGVITRYAFLQTESEAAARETALIQSQGKLSVAEGRLASLTGLPPPLLPAAGDAADQERRLERFGELAGVAGLIEAVLRSASAHSPSLRQAALAGRKAEKQVGLASAGYLPTLSASYSHSFDAGTRQALDWGSGAASLSASLPLDLWKTRAGVEAAGIAAQQAQLAADDAQASLRLDIQSAAYECISSARSALSAGKALEYAENYYRSVLELFQLSSASSSELSDAQALLSANRSALITARYSFLGSLSRLRSLAGLETESELLALME